MDANNDQSTVVDCYNSLSSKRSNYPRDPAEKVLKIANFQDYLKNQEIIPEEFVDLIKPPAYVYDLVYQGLAVASGSNDFPSSMNKKSKLNRFVRAVLQPIVGLINRQFPGWNLQVHDDSVLPKNADSCIPLDSIGKMDYVIQYSKRVTTRVTTRLMVVETKSGNIDVEAYQQCMIHLLAAYELNKDKLPLYGFCSNAIDWNVIKYDGNKFRMLFKRTVMIPRMEVLADRISDDDGPWVYKYKQYWLDGGYPKMIDIIYSCLKGQMTRVQENSKAKEPKS